MITNKEKEIEKIFISYNRVLEKLKLLGITTKSNKEINHKDLRQAINIMEAKHPYCRWKCKKKNSKKNYILNEGFCWLIEVYFQNQKAQIDADIEFFRERIKLYENFLKVKPKILWNKDMPFNELSRYFQVSIGYIINCISKMKKLTKENYKYYKNGELIVKKEGIKWLCQNCFKKKYLELLEEYKMELTQMYINQGYPYDIF